MIKTNNDLLNSMSIEKKAKFLPSICKLAKKTQHEKNMCVKAECEDCLLEWLKKPVDDEKLNNT